MFKGLLGANMSSMYFTHEVTAFSIDWLFFQPQQLWVGMGQVVSGSITLPEDVPGVYVPTFYGIISTVPFRNPTIYPCRDQISCWAPRSALRRRPLPRRARWSCSPSRHWPSVDVAGCECRFKRPVMGRRRDLSPRPSSVPLEDALLRRIHGHRPIPQGGECSRGAMERSLLDPSRGIARPRARCPKGKSGVQSSPTASRRAVCVG